MLCENGAVVIVLMILAIEGGRNNPGYSNKPLSNNEEGSVRVDYRG